MNRRRFLKGAARLGTGLEIGDSLLRGEKGRQTGGAQQTAAKLAQAGAADKPAASLQAAVTATSVITLDGEWLLGTDPENVGRAQRWYARSVSTAKPARVPGIIQEGFPAYHGVAWYWREFGAPAHPYRQGRYLLRFGAVDYLADVWVNDLRLGGHEGGETPFVLDATDAVKPGDRNRLAVRVLNPGDKPIDGFVLNETPHRNKMVNYVNGNSYDIGGIIESVELLMAPAVRIENLYVRPDWRTGNIHIQANVRNTLTEQTRGRVKFTVAPALSGETLVTGALERDFRPGDTPVTVELQLRGYRLWDMNDPYLYRVTAQVKTEGAEEFDETSLRCGFRDFRVVNGYFRLNDKRILLRSTHTGNHCPISQIVPPSQAPDLLRRDLLYAKVTGFNTVRFISGVSHPYQLDLCDEIGLMVYEECYAAWLLADSPKMRERYELSVREMVLRDRNHPSLTIWGMLNETDDTPVFREAVSALHVVRTLDDTRLVLLSSGRWDGQLGLGSVSNPGSAEWEPVWGKERAGSPPSTSAARTGVPSAKGIPGYVEDVGDVHFYPEVPQSPEVNRLLRTLGKDSKPVFLSEYGIGSMMDVIHEARGYEQVGIRPDIEDYALMRSMADRLTADWNRFGMDGVYPFPEDFLRDSQRRMARRRLLGFNLLRSNPRICGYNLTGMLDHGMTGEGVWRFWRDWKLGAMDAMQDGWWPLRWCLFVEPTHIYGGRTFKVEAVLANEDVLGPEDYPVRFRICGPSGIVWERHAVAHIPQPSVGDEGLLAVPVLSEEVALTAQVGSYELVANLEHGGAPLGRSWQFYLSDAAALPRLKQDVTLWGIDAKAESWLEAHGIKCRRFGGSAPNQREIILVGDLSKTGSDASAWKELARRMAQGCAVVFLSPLAFHRETDPVGWLPLVRKGRCYKFHDWLYHKECVAKPHPVFEGLQGKGILDSYYYEQVIPHYLFDGQDTPDNVAAVAFATGYSVRGGYASGVLLGSYRFGEGTFIVNSFPVLEHVDAHPTADRLLLNLIQHSAGSVQLPLAPLPPDFDSQLRTIGYL